MVTAAAKTKSKQSLEVALIQRYKPEGMGPMEDMEANTVLVN